MWLFFLQYHTVTFKTKISFNNTIICDYFFCNNSYLTKISFNNTAHIQGQIIKYTRGLTVNSQLEPLVNCQQLWWVVSLWWTHPLHSLHLRCCDEDTCESIVNSDLSARATREMSTASMSCESLIICSSNAWKMSMKNIMRSRGQKRLQFIIS